MRTPILVAAALARLGYAQDFDFDMILDAEAPSEASRPLPVATATSSVVDSATVAASILAEVQPTTASVTGAAASAASTQEPSGSDLEKPVDHDYADVDSADVHRHHLIQLYTIEALRDYPEFHSDARNAATPAGYTQTFNTAVCAKHCDEADLCTAFNIYIEREPSLSPTRNDTDPEIDFTNPTSISNEKCSLRGSSIDASSATNEGGYRGNFQVVIAGSNGYDKTNGTTPATPPGDTWSPPAECPGGAVNAGGAYHLGSQSYPGAFNPPLCARAGRAIRL